MQYMSDYQRKQGDFENNHFMFERYILTGLIIIEHVNNIAIRLL